jgi:hypothetical protein
LRARPSLYDLLRYRNIEGLSIAPITPTSAADLPPLPNSPASSLSAPPTPVRENRPGQLRKSVNMPPKAAKDDGEEKQYGKFCQ